MKTITIRDLRQRWPEAEAALQVENEILITRDSEPVAKLVRVTQRATERRRWNPEEHRRWIKKVFGKKVFPSSDVRLAASRGAVWHPEEPDAVRVSRFAGSGVPDGTAPAPEFWRQTLPFPGSLALGSDGGIEGLTLDDSR